MVTVGYDRAVLDGGFDGVTERRRVIEQVPDESERRLAGAFGQAQAQGLVARDLNRGLLQATELARLEGCRIVQNAAFVELGATEKLRSGHARKLDHLDQGADHRD